MKKKWYIILSITVIGAIVAAFASFGYAMNRVEASPSPVPVPTPTVTKFSATPTPVPVPVPGPTKTVTEKPKPAPTVTRYITKYITKYKATEDCKEALDWAKRAVNRAFDGFDNADRYSDLISRAGEDPGIYEEEHGISDKQSEIYQKFLEDAETFEDWKKECK